MSYFELRIDFIKFNFSCFNKTYDVISDQSEALILSNANIVDYEVSYKLQWIQGEK